MNQQCKVCGEPAAGFHFGAFTCEGCKSFFGRSYNNLSSISECKNEGKCIINKKNRTSCKACRLRKCLLVGMSKSGSRYGRRSNWFKIHCLLQEQQQAAAAAAAASHRQQSKTPPPPLNMLGHHPQLDPRLHHQLAAAMSHQAALQQQGRKEDAGSNLLLHLGGLDEYKNSTSPSISSPESHNSDSSVEVSDARLGSRGGGIFGKSSGLADLHPMGPPPNGLKDNLFVPLPFASLASLAPTMFPPSSAFLSPSAAAAAAAAAAFNGSNGGAASHLNSFHFPPTYLYQQHLKTNNSSMHKSPLTVNNNNRHIQNNNDSNNGGDVYSKRFFLDAILQSQRSPSRSPRIKEEEEEEDAFQEHEESTMTSKRTSEQQHIPISRKKLLMPCLSPPCPQEELQENPMDLSMKTCRIRQSDDEDRRSSPYSNSVDQDAGTEQDEDVEDEEDNEINEGDTDYDRAIEADEEDEDEMMTNAHNHHQIHIARSTPMDLTTKA